MGSVLCLSCSSTPVNSWYFRAVVLKYVFSLCKTWEGPWKGCLVMKCSFHSPTEGIDFWTYSNVWNCFVNLSNWDYDYLIFLPLFISFSWDVTANIRRTVETWLSPVFGKVLTHLTRHFMWLDGKNCSLATDNYY